MKKLSLIVLVVGIMLAAGCTGDDPSGPGGDLAVVTNFSVDVNASTGTNVVLVWDAVTDGPDAIDGYKIYLREDSQASWPSEPIATIPVGTTNYTHAATYAGQYGIWAYEGDNTSSAPATDDDLPNFVSDSYTIWNNYAPATEHSGFIFGATSGQTCLAGSSDNHDMYCYDGGQGNKTWLYSGDYGTYGGGNDTDFYEHASGYGMPGAGPWSPPAGPMVVGDVIFAELYDGYWVKVYITAKPQYPGGSDNQWGLTFYYDFQPIEGLKLFSTASTP